MVVVAKTSFDGDSYKKKRQGMEATKRGTTTDMCHGFKLARVAGWNLPSQNNVVVVCCCCC